VPLELIADATYRSDQSVLYWWLIAYSYPDGGAGGDRHWGSPSSRWPP